METSNLRADKTIHTSHFVASDISHLRSASSFVVHSGLKCPKRSGAFNILTTSFCNGADLCLPLPENSNIENNTFQSCWKTADALREIPNCELSDEEFAKLAPVIAKPSLAYAEGAADDIAEWIAFQFGEGAPKMITQTEMHSNIACTQIATIGMYAVPDHFIVSDDGNTCADTIPV